MSVKKFGVIKMEDVVHIKQLHSLTDNQLKKARSEQIHFVRVEIANTLI